MKQLYHCIHILLILLAVQGPALGQQKTQQSKQYVEFDIFDQLQQNVWYLPTADSKSTLYITELGSKGQPIVVLHGGPGNDFHYLVKPLRQNLTDHRFILFDQRGSLFSPVPDSMVAKLSVSTLVEDLEMLRKSLGQKKMVLFGHSFGSFLAMAYYLKYPEHVSGLLLSATLPPFTNATFTLEDFATEMRAIQEKMRARTEVKQILREQGIPPDNDSLLNARQKSLKAKIEGRASFNIYQIKKWDQFQGGGIYYNPQVARAIGNTMDNIYDIRPTLDNMPIPICVIQGDNDYVDPSAKRWAELVQQYPTVRVFVIKNAGHYSWIDEPEMFQKYFVASLGYIGLDKK